MKSESDIAKVHMKRIDPYYDQIRKDLINLIPENVKIDAFLDVGCGTGATSEFIRTKFNVNFSVGIEINEKAAAIAKNRVDMLYQDSIEDDSLILPQNKFDLVVFADVIEHLVDPWSTLIKTVRSVRSKGYVLFSIPNVQHWRVLLSLIRGNWKYSGSGIFDRTHLRFFTIKSIVELVNHAGLEIVKINSFRHSKAKIINLLTLNSCTGFLTYQYYILAQKIK